jgi:serine phosphatase RsbU (regulator of sigma subunit)
MNGNTMITCGTRPKWVIDRKNALVPFEKVFSPPEEIDAYLGQSGGDWFFTKQHHLICLRDNEWTVDKRAYFEPGFLVSSSGTWLIDKENEPNEACFRVWKLGKSSFELLTKFQSPLDFTVVHTRDLDGYQLYGEKFLSCSIISTHELDDKSVPLQTAIIEIKTGKVIQILEYTQLGDEFESTPGMIEQPLLWATIDPETLFLAYHAKDRFPVLRFSNGSLKEEENNASPARLRVFSQATRVNDWFIRWAAYSLMRYDHTRWYEYPVSGVIDNAAIDAHGIPWFSTGTNLYKYDRDADRLIRYTESDGIPASGIQGMAAAEGYGLWLLSNEGLVRFNEPEYSGKLDISRFRADSLECALNHSIVLPYEHNSVQIDFHTVTMRNPEACTYSYTLLGLNSGWSPRSYQRFVRYENLQPGKYTLIVRSWLRNGQEVPNLRLQFYIRPPWYRTPLAYGIYLLIPIWGAYFFTIIRTRVLRREKKKLANLIEERTSELQEANRELAEEQRRISDSIAYAAYIQRSILPHPEEMVRYAPHSFVFWREKDVVGGDFYYLQPLTQGMLMAVVDCTGHGVPGALLTMSANSLLNTIVREKGVTDPAEILRLLHDGVAETLRQHADNEQQDGLDIALVRIESGRAVFCGARLSLRIVSRDESGQPHLTILKGARFSIGGVKHDKPRDFVNEETLLVPGDRLYLTSDGIIDQLVRTNGKATRLGSKRFEEWLLEMQDEPIERQGRWLEAKLDVLSANYEQRDDITVAGVEV